MVRIPSAPRVEQVAAFPEPDHAPELEMQRALEEKRDGRHPSWEETYPTDEERHGWAWAYVGTDDLALEDSTNQDSPPVDAALGDDPAAVPSALSSKLADQGVRERLALHVWRRGGEKGPRPKTPAIEALGKRRGCTPARTD